MTSQPEIKLCANAVEALALELWDIESGCMPLEDYKHEAETVLKNLLAAGYTITRAEPAAPSSDEVVEFPKSLELHLQDIDADGWHYAVKCIRTHIASLEADNKRLREDLSAAIAWLFPEMKTQRLKDQSKIGRGAPKQPSRRQTERHVSDGN